jgi:hypothetical protein
LIIRGAGNNAALLFNHANSRIEPYSNSVTDLGRPNAKFKDLHLSGNVVIGTSGKGIDFSATSDGSGTMTSEVLDDYETGTFTPTLVTAGASDATYGIQVGTYTKIGNKVHIQGRVRLGTLGTLSGTLYMGGLPFTTSGTANNHSTLQVGQTQGLALAAGANVSGFVNLGDVSVTMTVWDSTAGTSSMTAAELSADGGFMFSAEYIEA